MYRIGLAIVFLTTPLAHGINRKELIKTKMENSVRENIKRVKAPSVAVGLVLEGQITSKLTTGQQSANKATDSQTMFQIGSITKILTAMTVIKLVQEGKIRLDQPIAELLPQYCEKNTCKGITIDHLLSNSSGVIANGVNAQIEEGVLWSRIVQNNLSLGRGCAPGSCFHYNNAMFSLLGEIVAKAGGGTFENIVQKRLLEPAGLLRTVSGFAGLKATGNFVEPYLLQKNGYQPSLHSQMFYQALGAAGYNSCLDDMMELALLELGKKPNVLSASDLKTLHQPRIKATDVYRWFIPQAQKQIDRASYCYGHRLITYRKVDVIFHTGWLKGSKNILLTIPSRDFAVVVLQNTESTLHLDIAFDLIDILLEA